ncbi:hypothetical protein H0A36_15330 [Endozoicomonas sp. SM1973]|uniref:Uncharacterized protein n=1 Tax=Spartinivicinus marinus TaxID=2994442 RepID=A0A853I9Q3_9GAMM|nr:hypothetical protein [Spartinivicinus marinus]MCX4026198.1 hypothetical protein [Spartinivicinus marinus]NYZ67388.1 hypothetical protein [Spartinivicinus marinus]
MRSLWYTAVFSVVFSVVSVNTHAKTPDGMTPAEETVCDVLKDATPGLFGLCNAYCEAQDLGPDSNKNSMEQLLSNYNKKKTENDPDMPCLDNHEPEPPECPCCHLEEGLPEVCTSRLSEDGNTVRVVFGDSFVGATINPDNGTGACRVAIPGVREEVRTQSVESIAECMETLIMRCPPEDTPRTF